MAIRTRITGLGHRADILRKNKARHHLIRVGTRHCAVWQTLVQDGNPRGGMTAAQLRNACHLYHPQVLKDLIDHRLVARRAKNSNGEYRYIADDKGRGSYVQVVEVEVELLEDEAGRFVTKTTLIGAAGSHGRIIRSLARRKIKFNVPLPQEPGVMPITGVVNVDNPEGFNYSQGSSRTQTIDVTGYEVEDPLLLEATATILPEE
jgi:hypothetical protein